MNRIARSLLSQLPDIFGRRKIAELEVELENALSDVDELRGECEVVSSNFEKECWRAMRRLLKHFDFDWSNVDQGTGVTADEAEEFILEAFKGLRSQLDRLIPPLEPATEHKIGDEYGVSDEVVASMLDYAKSRRSYDFSPQDIIAALTELQSRRSSAANSAVLAAHPDNRAVNNFAIAMKAKLEKKRTDGRAGWDNKSECSAEFLSTLLRDHVGKGDPIDVGNLAMMLHQRGERIMP